MVSATLIRAVGPELPIAGACRSTQADHDVRAFFGAGLPEIAPDVIRSVALIMPNLAFVA